MNSRQRVERTLSHGKADRIPIDFWASAGTVRNIEANSGGSFDRFLDERDVDFRYLAGPRYCGPPLDGDRDIWGVKRKRVSLRLKHGVEVYEEALEPPLAFARSAADVARYAGWPSPDAFDYSGIEAQCDAVLSRERVVVFMGDRLNRIAQLKPAMYLRGMENILTDMAADQDMAAAIFLRIRGFYGVYLERIMEAANGKIDIVLTGDDFGTQNGLLISPDAWREFLAPGFGEYMDIIRKHGARAMHHTCGSVSDIIPDMIERGLDVLQSIQPDARHMSLGDLLAEYGRALCFQGGISVQKTMPFGTPADIRREVERMARRVGDGGGFIFCTAHNIQADTPYENIIALLDAYREYGQLSTV